MQIYPSWIKIYKPSKIERLRIEKISKDIADLNLHTICYEALCPNRFECLSHGVATFLILGNICTRSCKFCYVKKGIPKRIDRDEPKKVANIVKKLNLSYVVITCVTRDDLKDSGASVFVNVVKEIRKSSPDCKIELLISDLNGNYKALEKIVKANPDVLGHNIDIARRLHKKIKPNSSYTTSINLLRKIKEISPGIKTKSGLMLGLGENKEDILKTIKDIKQAGVDFLTIGQYIPPSEKHARVEKFYTLKEFKELEKVAYKIGFEYVLASPLTRSSYRADRLILKLKSNPSL
ncbi:MAG: lipoyl synthase [Candidatus Altiarchaeota archaeon]